MLAMVLSHHVPAAAMPALHCYSHRDADVQHAAAAIAAQSVPTWQGEMVADATPVESCALCPLCRKKRKNVHE